jgi:hypothetical protein
MSLPDWIGTIGVTLLLLAFGLNLLPARLGRSGGNLVSAKSYLYLYLNFFGAALAGLASVLIHYLPFVILESVWGLVSLLAIIKKHKN